MKLFQKIFRHEKKKISIERLEKMNAKTLAKKAKILHTMSNEELSKINVNELKDAERILNKKIGITGRVATVCAVSTGVSIIPAFISFIASSSTTLGISAAVGFGSFGIGLAAASRCGALQERLECLNKIENMISEVKNQNMVDINKSLGKIENKYSKAHQLEPTLAR